MKNKGSGSGSGGGSADLTPIYNSLSALSLNKLESTAFTFFTNTLTISGAGLPYQIDFSDVSVLSANSRCLYNITDTISGLSLTTASIVKITGPDLISKNSFDISDLELNIHSMSSNTITISGVGKIDGYEIGKNSFRGSSFKGYLMMTGHNIQDNLIRSEVGVDFIGPLMTKNTFQYNKLCDFSIASFTSNVFNNHNIINLNVNSAMNNTLTGIGNFNLTANGFHNHSVSGVEAGYINISYAQSNTLSNVKCHIDAKNIYNNTINWCYWLGKIQSFTGNSLSNFYFDGCISYFANNTIEGDMLKNGMGESFKSNSISTMNDCDLGYINSVFSNTFNNISHMKLTAHSSFKDNNLSEIGDFEFERGKTNCIITGNSIHAYSLSFKDMDTDIFTNNSFTIGNFLDFNYGSSNVYDASLNYLLSDYVPETKVLGKYNLVPYVRSLMNGGGGGAKQSICAYDKNIAAQAQLWTDEIGTLNLNIVNSTNVITSAGATWHGTIDKCFINHWDNKSYGLFSLISFSGDCRIKELIYDRRQNTVEKTGSLFSGNNLFIDTLKYSGITTTAEQWNQTSDYYPLARGATISEADLSFSGCQVAHLPLYSNTISKLKMSGSVPYQVGSTLSIRSFFWKDFSTFPSNEGYLGIPFNSCTIDNLYIDTNRLYTNTSVFGHCSIKNAFVVCTPLAWDMSSGSYRSIVREMISMLSNTTTDIPPMSFVSDWPN